MIREAFDLLVREIGQRRTAEGFRVTGVLCTERERLYRRPGDYERVVKALTVDDEGVLLEDGRFFDLYGDGDEMIGLVGVAQSMREIRKIRERSPAAANAPHMQRRPPRPNVRTRKPSPPLRAQESKFTG